MKTKKKVESEFYIALLHFRSSPPKVFLGKGVLKICSQFTGEHSCQNVISSNFIEITLWHGCSPVNLPHVFKTLFPKNTSGGLLLAFENKVSDWGKEGGLSVVC